MRVGARHRLPRSRLEVSTVRMVCRALPQGEGDLLGEVVDVDNVDSQLDNSFDDVVVDVVD